MGFESLLDILKRARQRYPSLDKRLDEASALGRWEISVGAAIAKHTRVIRVESSVLWVEVDHPIWKSELHHRKRQILDRLNETLSDKDKQAITDILFLDPRKFSGKK
jgi:predicted nucleic acid-binding Zn ribbon protein